MLHIHNGDASADVAKQSSLPGEHFAWRESLITGPTPAGASSAVWRRVRAQHLSESYGVDLQECERGLLEQAKTLRASSEHEEVVLWFEHDLFCQVHLLYLLDWFWQRNEINAPLATKLSLVCIGEFPGKENFRGLGELDAVELASLFPARLPVTTAQLQLAASAWRAYCFPDPTAIEKLLQAATSTSISTSPLPSLQAALQAHLRRFPDTTNGLGRVENRALQLIDEGLNNFTELFARFGAAESIYGFGDAQFWLALQRLSAAANPFLTIASDGNADDAHDGKHNPQPLTPDMAWNARLELTSLGRSALKGEVDFVGLNGIDLWLGGVHLQDPENLWRWDEDSETIVRARKADE